MRKSLLLTLLLTASLSHAQMRVYPASVDPNSNNWAMYWNDVLSVRMFQLSDMSVEDVFGKDIREVLRTNDSIYVVLKRDRYTLWMPDMNMVFKVEPTYNQAIHLGDHLIVMMRILRDYRASLHRKSVAQINN